MTASNPQDARFMKALLAFDETEQLIITRGIRALADDVFDIPKFEAWTGDLVRRHREGEKLTVNDLLISEQAAA